VGRAAPIIRAISLVREAARTTETSVDIYLTTRQYIPEDSEFLARRRENLKSHKPKLFNALTEASTTFPSVLFVIKTERYSLEVDNPASYSQVPGSNLGPETVYPA
jgi:hypothetical protein